MNKLRVLMEQPPPARGDAEQQLAELRTYVSRMVQELQFLFKHMDARATDYDPYDSGLLARNTQDAIDELTAGVHNVPTPYPNNPAMDGTAYPGASNSYARGDHVHPTDTNLVPVTRKVNGKALSEDISLSASDVGARASSWTPSASDVGAIPTTEKGAASGVASLGSDGKVPSGQLPTIPTPPSPAAVTPLMDGLGYVGDSAKYAKEDHVHPKDTSKANFDTEILVVNMGTVSSLPKTVSNAKITADHVVIQAELGTPTAQTGDWTVTTSAGSVTLSGTISGSTTVTLVLGNSGGTVS